ncbi:unnamed protein product [Ilex paraguariensis]|uniref:Uncharacterized protein n=1 Tax=Ilex paraguariensis TaxID=185542 RepID=A0ABC8TVG8_9AQUA
MQEDKRSGFFFFLVKLLAKGSMSTMIIARHTQIRRILSRWHSSLWLKRPAEHFLKVFVKAVDLDISAVMGMGFLLYRGGIMFWADSVGSNYIYSRLNEWSNMYGGFFKPSSI